jgi:EAL and modified HD-GYP domain-containing signal transduction protein
MFGILKGLLGKQEVAVSDDPFGRNPEPVQVRPETPPPAPRRETGLGVHRDEIIGDGSRLVGYRFQVFCQGSTTRPPADAVVPALLEDHLVRLAQRRLALVPLAPDEWHRASFHALIAPQTIFLVQSADRAQGSPDWLPLLSEIKSRGGRVALGALSARAQPSLLDLADLVIFDYKDYALESLEKQVKSLRASHPELAIAADRVGSWAEHRLCQGLGIRYSLGGFAALPDEQGQGQQLNQSRVTLIEMLNLLRRDAEPAELVAVAKRDPGVAVKLLDLANSPLSGLGAPVASLQQALMVLGRDPLYRWLSLGMYRTGSDRRDETLLEIALRRACFLELLGQGRLSRHECDELFLVGILSLLDSLLGVSMDRAIERMTLPDIVRKVLLQSEGPYGRFLMLALATEKGQPERMAVLAAQLGIADDRVEACRGGAEAWAEEALRAN